MCPFIETFIYLIIGYQAGLIDEVGANIFNPVSGTTQFFLMARRIVVLLMKIIVGNEQETWAINSRDS